MSTTVFWNTSHARQRDRAADPLGLDALREAMADCLVPHLTGGTRHADDYLWVLVGLRWARGEANTPVDADVWEEFRQFERALKQYWHKWTTRRDFLGKREVAKLCEGDRPKVSQPILQNERATGLLGTYIASLRAISLVDTEKLAPTNAGQQLIRGVAFHAQPRTFTSWAALRAAFATTESQLKRHRRALAPHLFHHDSMRRAAAACLRRRGTGVWSGCDLSRLSAEQRRVARACATVLDVEQQMIEAFAALLEGQNQLDAHQRTTLLASAARVRKCRPIPDTWAPRRLAKALDTAWAELAAGRRPERVLLTLHFEVTKRVRGNEVWISERGNESLVTFRPNSGGHDFRFANLKRLVSETRWSPSAHRA